MNNPLTICVVGLMADQQRQLVAKTAQCQRPLVFHFVDGDGSHHRDLLPAKADFVLVTRFCRHSRYYEARDKYPPDTVIFIKGGVSVIIRKIFELAGGPAVTVPTTNQTPERKTMPRGVYDRTKAKPRTVDSYASNATTSDRVYWTEEELAAVADEWVIQRMECPLESASELFERAQRKVLPGDRQRTIPGVGSQKPLASAILKSWKSFTSKSAEPPASAPPEYQIVTLEVPRKLTVEEMLATLDEPALEALLSAKRLLREQRFHELLAAVAANAGATNLPKIDPYIPNLDAFASGKKSNPRIAVVGLPNGQSEELLLAAQNAAIPAQLRFPNGKDKETMSHCDYAIVYRQGPSAESDRAIGQLGRSRVVLMDTHDTPAILQQLRNLTSRQ